MKKYLVIYRAPQGAVEKMAAATPEDAKAGMEPWMAWAEKCGAGLVDMGSPLGAAKKVTKQGTSDGDMQIVGYSVLEAEDMDGAVAMLKEHPHLDWMNACEVEVHEAMPLPGM